MEGGMIDDEECLTEADTSEAPSLNAPPRVSARCRPSAAMTPTAHPLYVRLGSVGNIHTGVHWLRKSSEEAQTTTRAQKL